MYQNPKRAKKLYKEIVPKTVDEYLDFIEKAKNQNELQLLMNPVWHVHNGHIPKEDMIMTSVSYTHLTLPTILLV